MLENIMLGLQQEEDRSSWSTRGDRVQSVLDTYRQGVSKAFDTKITLETLNERKIELLGRISQRKVGHPFFVSKPFFAVAAVTVVLITALLIYATVMWIIFLNNQGVVSWLWNICDKVNHWGYWHVRSYNLAGKYVIKPLFVGIPYLCVFTVLFGGFGSILLLPLILGEIPLVMGCRKVRRAVEHDREARKKEAFINETFNFKTNEELQEFLNKFDIAILMWQIEYVESRQASTYRHFMENRKESEEKYQAEQLQFQEAKDECIEALKKYGVEVNPLFVKEEGKIVQKEGTVNLVDRRGAIGGLFFKNDATKTELKSDEMIPLMESYVSYLLLSKVSRI